MEQSESQQQPLEQSKKEIIFNEEFKTKTPVNLQGVTVHGNQDIFVVRNHNYLIL